MADKRPIIGITIGEPAGIGSEIAVKLLSDQEVYKIGRPIIIGSEFLIKEGMRIARVNKKAYAIKDEEINKVEYSEEEIKYIDCKNIRKGDFDYGKISAKAGRAAGEYIKKAVQLALENKINAIVTCPIHKESFTLGGWGKRYAGHTEMISDLTGTKKYAMVLACDKLRVIHVTTHVSLRKSIEDCKKGRILDVIQLGHNACRKLGIQKPRIGVAGLNPHAGDGGIFGDEEIKEIMPAIKEAQDLGFDVSGPISADTIFCKAKGGMFDIVIAMNHDQGHIPLKYAGFLYNDQAKSWGIRGVNITVGLPIIRVSVDHGTAFGKAGKGTADYTSLKDAYRYAVEMASN
ncbi:MAG: 4-hydroxythreonine-4-phosphate dehydrogenase PdxA [Candidatus Omnitrophica bacterium]|nr:4-hydroxythreonine-4-phosphate dehydrogenase PdxA [Candidatus Omnitrophota bacterium]